MRTTLGAGLVALVAALASGCSEGVPEENAYVVLADISKSTEKLGMLDDAKKVLGARVASMEAPSRATFLAFNMEVGSSTCPPVRIDLQWSDNSTEVRDNRESYVAPARAAIDPYVECSLASFSDTGTDVFGGIAQAASALDGVPGVRTIDVVTDGCHVTQTLRTCKKKVADAGWRAEAMASLADSLTPDLSGVLVTFHGVGRGSRLQSDANLGLKELYKEYATQTGATVAFED